MQNGKIKNLSYLLLLLAVVFPVATLDRQFVLVISQDDIKDLGTDVTAASKTDSTEPGFDDFLDSDAKLDHELDPGSWSPIFEPGTDLVNQDEQEAPYYQTVRKMVTASSRGDARGMERPRRRWRPLPPRTRAFQTVMGFFYGMGMVREKNKAKSFLFHHFASEGDNMQSKMALAYAYTRQEANNLLSRTNSYSVLVDGVHVPPVAGLDELPESIFVGLPGGRPPWGLVLYDDVLRVSNFT